MSLLDDVSIMVTPNGVKSNVLFGVLPTPTEGSELVTNGNFATDSDWTKGTGWTISGGSANFDSSGQSDNANISQSLGVDISGIVNVDFTQGDNTHYWNNGSTNFKLTFTFTRTSGTDRIRVVTSGTSLFFRALNGDNLIGSIDNVSVKEYISADMDFTRASTATRLDSSGDIVNVATGVPRLDYTGASCPHILVEPERTNTLTVSEPASGGTNVSFKTDFNALGFTNCIFFDGDKSVDRFFYQHGVPASTEVTLSFFVKMEDGSEPVVGGTVSSGDFGIVIGAGLVKPSTGGVIHPNVYMGNNVWRVSATRTTVGASSNNGPIKYDNSGVSTKAFRVVGLQAEAGSYATSYIPTTGITVTRNQELFSKTGISSLINNSEGVLYIEAKTTYDSSLSRRISLSDGTTDNRVSLEFDESVENKIKAFISFNNTDTELEYTASNLAQFNKIAIKYKVNDFAIYFNGSPVATESSGDIPTGMNQLVFNGGDGSNQFFGQVRNIQVYKTALSPTQLAALTT